MPGPVFETTPIGDVLRVRFVVPRLLSPDRIAHIASELTTLAQPAEGRPRPRLLLDFRQVEEIGSALLAALVEVQRTARTHGGELKLAELGEPVLELFRFTRLDTVFDIHESEHSAIGEFRANPAATSGLDLPDPARTAPTTPGASASDTETASGTASVETPSGSPDKGA